MEDVEANQSENSTETVNKTKEEPKVVNGEPKATTQATTKPPLVQTNQTSEASTVQSTYNAATSEVEEETDDVELKNGT